MRAASSQAGLVSERIQPRLGAATMNVGVDDERDVLGGDDTCFALFCTIIHGCLEKVLTCVDREHIAAWAAPLALEFDFVRFYEHMWAREGWRSHSLIPHTGIDCKEVLQSESTQTEPAPPEAMEPEQKEILVPERTAADPVSRQERDAKGAGHSARDSAVPERNEQSFHAQIPPASIRQSPAAQQRCSSADSATILVVYSYYEMPRAARNLRFFLERTRLDWEPGDSDACHARPRLQLLLVISGHRCSVPLPLAANVRVLRVENSGSDLGAYTDALEALGISLAAKGWRQLFAYLLFINSSCRGPFLPPYAGKLHWTEPFTSKITAQVKLVGPSIHFIPGDPPPFLVSRLHSRQNLSISPLAHLCNASESILSCPLLLHSKRLGLATWIVLHLPVVKRIPCCNCLARTPACACLSFVD